MDNKRKVSHVFYNNPQGSRLRGQKKKKKKKNRRWNCVQQIVIDAQLQIGKRGQKQS